MVHLAIGIHDIPVDRDSLLYNERRATALAGCAFFGIEDRDTYYDKRVIEGAIRAGDFLMSLSQLDSARYAVQGGSQHGSQGGMLAIAAAALDDRVKAIGVAHPAMAEHFAYRRGRAGGWPHVFADTTRLPAKPGITATRPYHDTGNFARLVRVPGFCTCGCNDVTVPPTTSYAVYNLITAPKTLHIVKETGHVQTPDQRARTDAFLLRQLAVPPQEGAGDPAPFSGRRLGVVRPRPYLSANAAHTATASRLPEHRRLLPCGDVRVARPGRTHAHRRLRP